MRRIFTSIRFQLIFVLVIFIIFTFFTISSSISQYLEQNEISSETKRLTVISKQIEERFEKMYTAESLLRGYDHISQKERNLYINVFLKPAFDNYFSTISSAYSDVEIGYYLPIFNNPVNVQSSKGNLIKKIIVMVAIPEKYGGGYIFSAIPQFIIKDNVNAVIYSINRIIFYLALITMLIVLIITSFFSVRILQIRKGLKNLEKNLDFRFPNYGGEIGDIATSINIMAENLKRNVEEMQKAEALKSLGLFTAGIVHEVRNPLTSIKGFATILSQKLQGKDEERFVKPILTETERLGRIVDDLLKYGKPTPLTLVKFNLRLFFNHILELAKQYESNKNIKFDLKCEDLTIVADERKLEELFLNLVINAIQAIDKEEGIIEIECISEGKNIKIIVQDNGSGMTEDTLKNIFVPFYTTKEHGTGLGLAIVHRIVEEHGGEIFVESKLGVGTKFIIVLPTRDLQ
ncbi:ATP-binding protein [Caldisericum exile]|uniref:histidine kinase n=1 Tax=Caldisericum exile (strain DSM 21853 / NBRC 104410 / AZM16c01) TaxID=511051 RepID=A0A7U6GEI3_CALEA|nr:ATP-binding protein [Caldisericum exile]BAL80927.1 two-component system sensor histidine kinase [Caldisericum exile AZM16c01]